MLLLTALEFVHSDLITVFMSLAHNDRAGGITELPWSAAVAPDGLQVRAIRCQQLQPVVTIVGHQPVAIAAHRHAGGITELPWPAALAPDGLQVRAIRCQQLQPVVVCVGHQPVAIAIHHHAFGILELPWSAALAPDGLQVRAVRCQQLQPVVAIVDHHNWRHVGYHREHLCRIRPAAPHKQSNPFSEIDSCKLDCGNSKRMIGSVYPSGGALGFACAVCSRVRNVLQRSTHVGVSAAAGASCAFQISSRSSCTPTKRNEKARKTRCLQCLDYMFVSGVVYLVVKAHVDSSSRHSCILRQLHQLNSFGYTGKVALQSRLHSANRTSSLDSQEKNTCWHIRAS